MIITQTEVRRHPVWRDELASPIRSDVPQRFARIAAIVTVLAVLGLVIGLLALRQALPAN